MLKSSQSDRHGFLHLTLSSAYLKGRISREERLRMALQGKEEPQQDGLKKLSVVFSGIAQEVPTAGSFSS
jgi:hypothetical protein